MVQVMPVRISEDLALSMGGIVVTLTPSQGLDLAEDLARKSFRRAMTEEAEALTTNEQRGGPRA